MEFINVKLSDIGEVVGGATPSTKNPDNYDGNIAWITPKDLAGYNKVYISKGERNINEMGFKSCSTKILPKNSVLFSSRAPIGYVAISANDLCTNQGFKSIIPNDKIDYKFLYYLLKHNKDYIASKGSGSTFKEVSGSVMKGIELSIPKNINDQKKISKVLFDIDKKIELNNEINNNLHELCNNLYFKLVSQLNDTNSSVESIKNVAKCVLGGTPSRTKKEYWNGSINWINSGEINKFRIIKASEKITELGLNKSSTTLLPGGTTVLAITGATLGQVSRLEIDSCANQSVIGIITNEKELNNYMYLSILNSINDLVLKQTGGAQQHINKNDVETHEIIVPSMELISQFDEIIRPLFDQISVNCFEINKLEQLRDTLLPKLMNGEIDLDNIEI